VKGPLVLLSGGDPKGDRASARLLALSLAKGRRLLYVPVAMRNGARTFGECWDWASGFYAKFGINLIDMWTDLEKRDVDQLANYGAVLFGGGNTFLLAAEARTPLFRRALRKFLASGGIYLGGSAGAILAGADVRTALFCGDRNNVHLRSFDGLRLLGDWSVVPHYKQEMRHALMAHTAQTGDTLLAIPGESAARIRDGRIKVFGKAATVFTPQAEFSLGTTPTLLRTLVD
jgi:dipeptidase E